MELKGILLATGLLPLSAGAAAAVDLTVVSWGGAYSNSQQKAYHEPYMAANPDVKIIKAIDIVFTKMRKEQGIVLSK